MLLRKTSANHMSIEIHHPWGLVRHQLMQWSQNPLEMWRSLQLVPLTSLTGIKWFYVKYSSIWGYMLIYLICCKFRLLEFDWNIANIVGEGFYILHLYASLKNDYIRHILTDIHIYIYPGCVHILYISEKLLTSHALAVNFSYYWLFFYYLPVDGCFQEYVWFLHH